MSHLPALAIMSGPRKLGGAQHLHLALRSSPAEVAQAPGQLRSTLLAVHARPYCQVPRLDPQCAPFFWVLERPDSAVLLPISRVCLLVAPPMGQYRAQRQADSRERQQLAGGTLMALGPVVLRLGGLVLRAGQDQWGCQLAAWGGP